jgi:hypothetical protein
VKIGYALEEVLTPQRKGDKEGLQKAVQTAVDNPFSRYIRTYLPIRRGQADKTAPTMTRESVRGRHQKLVETDWQTAGRTRIEKELGNEDRPVSSWTSFLGTLLLIDSSLTLSKYHDWIDYLLLLVIDMTLMIVHYIIAIPASPAILLARLNLLYWVLCFPKRISWNVYSDIRRVGCLEDW